MLAIEAEKKGFFFFLKFIKLVRERININFCFEILKLFKCSFSHRINSDNLNPFSEAIPKLDSHLLKAPLPCICTPVEMDLGKANNLREREHLTLEVTLSLTCKTPFAASLTSISKG